MAEENIALEMLVRSGSPIGVERLAKEQRLEDSLMNDKIGEAIIHFDLKWMWEEAEGGIDSDRFASHFKVPQVKSYFSKMNNVPILIELAGVLYAGTNAMMEDYAQATAIGVLGIDEVRGAIRRNLDNPELNDRMKKLVKSGYEIVLHNPSIDLRSEVDGYLSVLDRWEDLVDMDEVYGKAIDFVVEELKHADLDDEADDSRLAIETLVTRTDRGFVSQLFYAKANGEEFYDSLIEKDLIDRVAAGKKKKESDALEAPNAKVGKAVSEYEQRYGDEYEARNLAREIGAGARNYISRKMGEWFDKGMVMHVVAVANHDQGHLYDADAARELITKCIERAINGRDFDKLKYVLQLPLSLIDKDNAALKDVIHAYEINEETTKPEPTY